MEEFQAERLSPLKACQQKIRTCDYFILLLGHRYGSRPADHNQSYTELEYISALTLPDIAIIAFVIDPLGASEVSKTPSEDEAQRRFISRVRSSHVVRKASNAAKFREDVILALTQGLGHVDSPEESRQFLAVERPRPPDLYATPAYVGSAPFTGRADNLNDLDEWAESPDPLMVIEAIGGAGKSALSWEWSHNRSASSSAFHGRFWWSFYDQSASMTRCMQELLAYTTGQPVETIFGLSALDLRFELLNALRQKEFLVVLDGFERLLHAYHRFDPSKLRDDEIQPAKRTMIEANAEEIVRSLAAAGPSKILISTRLMPYALEGRFGRPLGGVRRISLLGLSDGDTATLLRRLGIGGEDANFRAFFEPLGNHPLLIGIIAGLVRDYRTSPSDFDSWLRDESAGAALRFAHLDLVQRRTHILAAALAGLSTSHRDLLSSLSVLDGAVGWETVRAINPMRAANVRTQQAAETYSRRPWRVDVAASIAESTSELDTALSELEDRGLLWWDRSSNSYDMHPIVRSYAYDQLQEQDRVQANESARNYFATLPPEDTMGATSVEDVRQTIRIFRTLVGADRLTDASDLWKQRLSHPLVVDLGANATVVELLTPLSGRGSVSARTDLVIAHSDLGQYREAIWEESALLKEAAGKIDVLALNVSLSRLGSLFGSTGSEILATRCVDFQISLHNALHWKLDANLYLKRGVRAAIHGSTRQALRDFTKAKRSPRRAKNPWIDVEIYGWRTFLRLVTGRRVSMTSLADVRQRQTMWANRLSLAKLEYRLAIRDQNYNHALAAAHECEKLQLNAGVQVLPARSALALAKLGRHAEAQVAISESYSQLGEVHAASRPHYLLALAYLELGYRREGAHQLIEAYRQAWCDGPPNCHHWNLAEARAFLGSIGQIPPILPLTPQSAIEIPHQRAVRHVIELAEGGWLTIRTTEPDTSTEDLR